MRWKIKARAEEIESADKGDNLIHYKAANLA